MELVAYRYPDQVQALMYESERVSGIQSLLYLGPDGEKLSHELRGFLPRQHLNWAERAFIRRNYVPHTYNSSEPVFWTNNIQDVIATEAVLTSRSTITEMRSVSQEPPKSAITACRRTSCFVAKCRDLSQNVAIHRKVS
jgi:hypothetical protein